MSVGIMMEDGNVHAPFKYLYIATAYGDVCMYNRRTHGSDLNRLVCNLSGSERSASQTNRLIIYCMIA